jgi:ribonucleotide monophosphatase NagD (HAD superfamily)
LLAELLALGLDVAEDELFTPVTAAANLVSAVPGARAFVIGTPEVAEQLTGTLQLTE